MAEDFKKYLASEVLIEQRTISYRNISRVFKVHVNAAKCMLYEFYEFQNAKKPQSVYATYLLSGIKKRPTLAVATNGTARGHTNDYDPDEHIPSSPPPFTSSMLEPSQQSSHVGEEEANQVPVRTVTLVREEALEAMKEDYETITSIHIYSLSPARIQDLVALTDISRGLFTNGLEDENGKIYGMIQNPDVRRRKGRRPGIPGGPASKSQPVKEETKRSSLSHTKPTPKGAYSAPPVKTEESSRPSSRDSPSISSSTKQPPTLKRNGSDLFRAFAKHGPRKSTPTAATPQPNSPDQDTTMNDADEGESEDEALFLDTGTRKSAITSKKRTSDAKKEREDKAAKLRKMMESDDEEEAAAPSVEKATGLQTDEPPAAKKGTDADADAGADTDAKDDDAAAEQVAWSESDSEKKQASKDKSEQDAATDAPKRRRRGKRKVMQKRTTKEDGYLVTREEAVWESFSEDEPEPAQAAVKKEAVSAAPKSTPKTTQSQGPTPQSQKPSAKKKGGGGGNIMSFFGKKNA
ncbi:uncharacterized protein Z520_00670 [Fonsecaea multimorphosa CBS 102226]|uniref:DNA polymerase delta subunit 3 n=1 Tax=Fonsecaea multimorphosa CBS 102226 TaxID=1442371 RepID=A0A0D2KCY1_9EURO|nr:uncharacterized protein Z520_00670 [Fonsecaea multimorphosa CBS 102226]KIY03978.1 hypothetical protein Z520_00670 [Fonsecaea multimorphosa CBS 102226]OAL31818.1 hypothetical protein AYO22_00688 [Fonsecaea multimorphosa]